MLGFPFVLDAFRDSGDEVLRLGLLALGEAREERAMPTLREYAEGVSVRVREAALLALSISWLPAANDYLVTLIERAPERRALEAIAALEPRHGDAVLMDRVRAVASTRGGAVQRAVLKAAPASS